MTDKCLQGVEQKRERALKRTKERRETAKGGKAVSDWSDDDKYADDKLHKEKQVECYERNRPVKRAMGLP